MSTTQGTASAPAGDARKRYIELSALGVPEYTLCIAGPLLLTSLFLLPWFSTSGYGTIHGHHGEMTGWQTLQR